MYYYAYINESNICTGTYGFPTQVTLEGYIYIGETDNPDLVGMYYNAETGNWEEPTYYYAYLDTDDVVISVQEYASVMSGTRYIRLDTLDQTLVGMWYDRTDNMFKVVPIHIAAEHSSSEISYKDMDLWLDDVIDGKADAASVYTKAEINAIVDGIEAGTGEAGADGATFTPSVSEEGVISWTNDKGLINPEPVNIKGADGVSPTVTISKTGTVTTITITDATGTHTATINDGEKGDAGDVASVDAYTKTQVDNMLNEKADVGHSHDYAPTTHQHTTADVTGLAGALAGKSDTSHTHTGYASSSHTHSDYFQKSGGTITGETNFSGGLVRLKGTQTLFNSGSMITVSSNNVQTMIAGSAIYSKVAISVSSDERLKENIADVDTQACIDFINAIDVKTFNYIGNEENPCVGVIAQDIEKLNPELAKRIVTVDEEGMLGVKTSDLVFPLIVAVQELTKQLKK